MHKTMSRENSASIIGAVKPPFRKELLFSFPVFPNGSSVQHSTTNKSLNNLRLQHVRRQGVTENRFELIQTRFCQRTPVVHGSLFQDSRPILRALPTALVYIFLSRFFVRGLMAGSVKG